MNESRTTASLFELIKKMSEKEQQALLKERGVYRNQYAIHFWTGGFIGLSAAQLPKIYKNYRQSCQGHSPRNWCCIQDG